MKLRKKAKTKRKLTPRQKRFVEAYLGDPELNATAAALKAGYGQSGASVIGHYCLHKSQTVADEIEERMRARAREARLCEADVLEKLKEVQEQAFRKARYAESIKALELLGRHIGMWPLPGNNVNVGLNMEVDMTTVDQESRKVLGKLQTMVDRLQNEYETGDDTQQRPKKLTWSGSRTEKANKLRGKKGNSRNEELLRDNKTESEDKGKKGKFSMADWPIPEDEDVEDLI